MNRWRDRPRIPLLTHATRLHPLQTYTGWIKRDDEIFEGVGGNKARKLEWILGDLHSRQVKELVSFGAHGSNHILTTAFCAQRLGLTLQAHLIPQLPTPEVAAKLHKLTTLPVHTVFHPHGLSLAHAIWKHQHNPGFITPGASSPLGALGYVNAAQEFMTQLREQGLDTAREIEITLPAGTLGTLAGLAIGFAHAGATRIRLQAVLVVPWIWNQAPLRLNGLLARIASLITDDPVERSNLATQARNLVHFHYSGYQPGYGEAQPEVYSLIEDFRKREGIPLDPTYTGKAMKFFLHTLHSPQTDVLRVFWHTYPSYFSNQNIRSVRS